MTALHLANLYGHPAAVRSLLATGANPHGVDAQGNTPRAACALSPALDDAQSRDVGRLLLEAVDNRERQAAQRESAKAFAESRGNQRLAAIR